MNVPRIESRARTEALPTPQARPRPSGIGDVSRGMQELGSALGKMHEQAAALQVTEALNALDDAATARLYNPDTGFFHQKGSAVIEASAKATEGLDEDQKKVAEGLTSELARSLFLRKAQERLAGYKRDIERHTGGQINQARTMALQTSEERGLDLIAQGAYADPGRFGSVMAVMENQHQDLSNSPEEYDAATVAWRRKATVSGMQMWLRSGDVVGAQKFLDAHRDSMGEKGADLALTLRKLTEKAKAESDAVAIVKKHLDASDPDDTWVDISALEVEKRKTTGALRKRLDDRISDESAYQKARISKVYNRASGVMAAAGDRLDAVDPVDLAWLEKRAGDHLAKLTAREQRRINKDKASRTEANRLQKEYNDGVVADFKDLMASDPDAAVETNVAEFVSERSGDNAARSKVLTLQAQAKKAREAGAADKIEAGAKRLADQIATSIPDTDKTKSKRLESVKATFRSIAYERLVDKEGHVKREDLDALVAEHAVQEVLPENWKVDKSWSRAEKIAKLAESTGLSPQEVARVHASLVAEGRAADEIGASAIEDARKAEQAFTAKAAAAGLDAAEAKHLAKVISTREGKPFEKVTTQDLERERVRRRDAEVFDKPASKPGKMGVREFIHQKRAEGMTEDEAVAATLEARKAGLLR